MWKRGDRTFPTNPALPRIEGARFPEEDVRGDGGVGRRSRSPSGQRSVRRRGRELRAGLAGWESKRARRSRCRLCLWSVKNLSASSGREALRLRICPGSRRGGPGRGLPRRHSSAYRWASCTDRDAFRARMKALGTESAATRIPAASRRRTASRPERPPRTGRKEICVLFGSAVMVFSALLLVSSITSSLYFTAQRSILHHMNRGSLANPHGLEGAFSHAGDARGSQNM